MMKLIFIALIGYGAWSYYNQNIVTTPVNQITNQDNNIIPHSAPEIIIPVFSCDGRQHCSQMTSYEEAVYFINNCPNTKMDGDHDGIPCERQFGR